MYNVKSQQWSQASLYCKVNTFNNTEKTPNDPLRTNTWRQWKTPFLTERNLGHNQAQGGAAIAYDWLGVRGMCFIVRQSEFLYIFLRSSLFKKRSDLKEAPGLKDITKCNNDNNDNEQ